MAEPDPAGAPLRPQARPAGPADHQLRPMARPGEPPPFPDPAATLATTPHGIDTAGLALLGLLSGPAGDLALLRLRDGSVVRAAPGDLVDGARVVAMEPGGLRLRRDGWDILLRLPA